MYNKEIIKDLLSRKYEEEWFEFKSSHLLPDVLGEYISAISNVSAVFGKSEGYLIFGIDDRTHKIKGTNFNYNSNIDNEPLKNYLARNLNPSIAFTFEEIIIEEKRIVMLKIPAAIKVPTSFKGSRHYRIGSSKVNLLKYPERESELWRALYLGYPRMINTESPEQKLTFNQLFDYYKNKHISLNKSNFKENLKLLTPDGKYNMLACYLADNGHINVRVAIFTGKDKASKLQSVKEFGEGYSLITIIDRVSDYCNMINIPKAVETPFKATREDIYLFDQECFEEALKNAFINNRWTDKIAPMITFLSDRVEITSFSGLAPAQTIDGFFKGISHPVNEELASIFLTTRISERSGKGVPMITQKYGKEAFDIQDKFVIVTIPYNWIRKEYEAEKEQKPINLSNFEKQIINFIEKNPNITQPELVQKTNKSKNTITRIIVRLKNYGILERIGSKKTGYWKINK